MAISKIKIKAIPTYFKIVFLFKIFCSIELYGSEEN